MWSGRTLLQREETPRNFVLYLKLSLGCSLVKIIEINQKHLLLKIYDTAIYFLIQRKISSNGKLVILAKKIYINAL